MFCYTLLLFISCLSVAGALSISFPPSGTPTAASDSQNVTWKRDKKDPSVQFYLQKIKLDQPGGPTVKSTPVPIDNSLGGQGTSPMMFNRAGLFEILAVNIQNGQPFFTTEITVAPNPTSSGGPPPPTGTSASPNKKQGMEPGTPKSSSSSATSTNTTSPTTNATSSSDASVASSQNNDKRNDHTALIIGAVTGGVGLVFIVGIVLLCLRYRTRRATSNFARSKMVRSYTPEVYGGRRTILGSEKGSDPGYDPSAASIRRGSLRPLDSVSNVHHYVAPILPPIPVARSVIGSDISSTMSGSSSARRTRERNGLRLSASTLSTSTSTSNGSLFPIPTLPPRTRTDRQMLIEQDIQKLQARMLILQGQSDISLISRLEREEELKQIHMKVDDLKTLHESRWALGLTDEVPMGLL
ncbi:hypothetical protein GYMLUDRAFT_88324 [Collybiopsis luxurians FD-317 M1]|uniref:Mid2 domain-containing protein n=1 Tax=Collybiopsis luxurians FD-317 M1 TaxID=944289 RepID=A0A0D0BGP2_9AGAR|nr:hypothetical protein GYMLUDRAFT_88324 [Collybiopsis luxurians FD-317 M1]